MKRLFAVFLITLCAVPALAETYVRVEKDGSKTYSDRPLAGGQAIDIQPAQTYSVPPPPPIGGSANSDLPREQQLLKEMNDFRYASCVLTPKSEETFQNPTAVNVAVILQPALRPSDVVDLRIDGTPVPGANATSFALPLPNRGAHTASVLIKDRYGKPMCNASTTFHVFRASVNSPARR
ncbi:MAG: DUF4124 domain-containing protein [Pseudomonadota bacterium]